MKGKMMENKQIEELALKAGFIEHKQYLQSFDLSQDVQDRLIREFAKLVEQATLERAAKKFRENAELCADWMVRSKNMYLDGADALDALKDSHE